MEVIVTSDRPSHYFTDNSEPARGPPSNLYSVSSRLSLEEECEGNTRKSQRGTLTHNQSSYPDVTV